MKPPPSLIDFRSERALLGVLMREPARFADPRVSRHLFAHPPHPRIFELLRLAHEQGSLAGDLMTASAALECSTVLELPRTFAADALLAAEDVLPDPLLTHMVRLTRRRQLRDLGQALRNVAETPTPLHTDDSETIATIAARAAELQNGDAPDPTFSFDTVAPERVEWLWSRRIPFGKLTILDGDPGLGKTALTLDLAARVSRGAPLPDDPEAPWPAAHVLLVNAEDGAGDTIRPRLDAAGADVSRCHGFPLDHVPILPEGLPHLADAIHRHHAALTIIDPLMAVLGPTIDAYKDQSVRRVLLGLASLAESTKSAIVVVRHLTKQSGPKALYRGGGSIAFSAAARATMILGTEPDPDAPDAEPLRALAVIKQNLTQKPPTLRFRVLPSGDSLRLDYCGTSSLTADDLVAPQPSADDAEPIQFATDFLRDLLTPGALDSEVATRKRRAAGISDYAWKVAKSRLHVRSIKASFSGGWHLSLPSADGS